MCPQIPLISLKNIRKEFPAAEGASTVILDGLDLTVEQGQFVAIRGESGSGKSTLLRILGLVDRSYSGEYHLGGSLIQDATAAMPRSDQEELRSAAIGFIFQEDRLLEHLSVRENIELPLAIRGALNQSARQRLGKTLAAMYRPQELADKRFLHRRRDRLSGGQRQRASILRALAPSPLLLLADEPTASLDRALKQEIFEALARLARTGKTVIVVSHDEIFDRADVVYELRDGKLSQVSVHKPVQTAEDGGQPSTPADTAHPARSETGWAGRLRDLCAPLRRAARRVLPRAPLGLQLSLASRELFRSWLFTLLALGALTTGSFQLTLLWSLEAGTQELLDDLIRKGSRLNRITVSLKPEQLTAAERFPDRGKIESLPGVLRVTPRREGIYRVQDWRGRDRLETIFGLGGDDPELEKLVFTAGKGFSSEEALEIIMSERSIQRLFEVPGDTVSDELRKSLLGKTIELAIARPPRGTTLDTISEDLELEVLPFQLKLAGIVAQAEADRNFYLPQTTQILLERWRLDEARGFELPLNADGNAWTVPATRLRAFASFPWEERLHVYFSDLDQVIPGHREVTALGYEARAEIFNYQWVIHTRRLAHLVITGLVTLALLVAGMVIAANILIGIKMRLKEIVLLKLLGMRNADITLIYIWNAAMAALLGTLLGFGAGTTTIHHLANFVRENYPGAEFSRLLAPTGPFFGETVLLGLAVALISSAIPALRAGQTDPVKGFGA